MKRHFCIYGLFLVVLTLTGACRKSTPAVPPAAQDSAHFMLLQPNPYLPLLDIYSVYMDTAKLNRSPIAYPGTSVYGNTPSGTRYLFCGPSGTLAQYFSIFKYFKPGAYYTFYSVDMMFSIGTPNLAFVEDDLSAPAAGYAKIRMIQGVDFNHRLNWIIHGGDTLGRGLGYRDQYSDTTSFRQIPAGGYLFDLNDYDAPNTFRASLQTTLEAGKIYTLFSKMLPAPDSLQVNIQLQLIHNK
jgi:hypothetical protein